MAENDFHTESESPVAPCGHCGTVLGYLKSQGEILDEVATLLRKAAPLLESRAAKVALGVERHPVLSALSARHTERKDRGRG